ncbi:complement decay-accelerating factor isoform X2 [Anoplopoma fimbria]|uniref:complement decay-accelerating factor isoform X2 n=1 Tax=Anoplopoma fimbria TaxID=229290 RepID=UPI0023EAA52E|nr:complement decay-accelerating factor isoform X2 [Anoplopoma fimbria]
MDVFLDTCGGRRAAVLLMLYSVVVKAAADCAKPLGGENTVLTNAALLMNTFPEGVEVTLECAKGFVFESGSGKITCNDNNWTEPDLICKKKDCGPPKPQPNMSFNTSAGTLFGAVIAVVCHKGFEVSGSGYKQCYAKGWSGRAVCELVTCGEPAKVTNGTSSWDYQDYPKYGEIIHYVCNKGFTLVGNNSVMCSETGGYDPQPPTCQGVTTESITITNMATTASPAKVSTSTDPPATPRTHRDKTVSTSATPAVSPSVRGGRDISTAEDEATTTSGTSTTSTPLYTDKPGETVDTNKEIGYFPVIISVVCVFLAVCIIALFLHKYLLKRKGSANGIVRIY